MRRMPAEWELHDATWITWPHEESDWPEKLEAVKWAYAEIVRNLIRSEPVEILCHSASILAVAHDTLLKAHVDLHRVRLHLCPNNRGWIRDSGATGVITHSELEWVKWKFNAWALYDNFQYDAYIPEFFSEVTGAPLVPVYRHGSSESFVLEGGVFDTDGEGTMLVTEECLQSLVQERNPGYRKHDYEEHFRDMLGATHTIWLGHGCAGDDTHGHVDDIARFVAPGVVVAAVESNVADENYEPLQDNITRLRSAADAKGRSLSVIELPMPRPIWCHGMRLPASYCNFYIANSVVLVPTFNDPNDTIALTALQQLFPTRTVVGIHSVDLVLGQGTLHCLTQQQPRVSEQ